MLWLSCNLEFIHLKEAVEELHFCLTDEASSRNNQVDSESGSLAKENIQKMICLLHPQVKQTLLDCFRKNKFSFLVSGEDDGSSIWYDKYVKSLFPRPDDPRRKLSTASVQSIKRILAEAPTVRDSSPPPAPSPGPMLSPSPGPYSGPATSPGPASEVPSSRRPAASPKEPFFPHLPKTSSLEPSANETSSASSGSEGVHAGKQSNNNKVIVIAVVVTASVTFLIAALFFLCCGRFYRTGSRIGRNDERPLLSLSLSDFSTGIYYLLYSFNFLVIGHCFIISGLHKNFIL